MVGSGTFHTMVHGRPAIDGLADGCSASAVGGVGVAGYVVTEPVAC